MPDYFTLLELRALPDVSNTTKYPNDRVEAVAAKFVEIIEREVGTAFIERLATETYDGGEWAIVPMKAHPREIVAATENGVDITASVAVKDGTLVKLSGYSLSRWASGVQNIEVTYSYGYAAEPPADIKEQALQATRLHLMSTSSTNWQNSRQTSMSTEMGVLGFVVAGPDRPTGYPELDAVIIGWRDRLNVYGFA